MKEVILSNVYVATINILYLKHWRIPSPSISYSHLSTFESQIEKNIWGLIIIVTKNHKFNHSVTITSNNHLKIGPRAVLSYGQPLV